MAIDNTGAGYLYSVLSNVVPTKDCGFVDRLALYRYDGQGETMIGYIDSRCGFGSSVDLAENPEHFHIKFDDKGGRL